MSTPLTREQACDKFIKQKMRDGAGGLNRIISRAAFEAGWSARDAEVERLRSACVAARDALHEATHELTNERCLIWCELAEKEVRAALAHKEPSDA